MSSSTTRRWLTRMAIAASLETIGACSGGGRGPPPTSPPPARSRSGTRTTSRRSAGARRWSRPGTRAPGPGGHRQEIPAGKRAKRDRSRDHRRQRAVPRLQHRPQRGRPVPEDGGLVNLSEFADGAAYIERSGPASPRSTRTPTATTSRSRGRGIRSSSSTTRTCSRRPESTPRTRRCRPTTSSSRRRRSSCRGGGRPAAIQPRPPASSSGCSSTSYPLYAAATGGTELVEDGKATFGDEDGTRWPSSGATVDQGLSGQEQDQGRPFADGRPPWRSWDRGPSRSTRTRQLRLGPGAAPEGTPAEDARSATRRTSASSRPARTRAPPGRC